YLDHVGQHISSMMPADEMVDKLLGNPSPAERRICLSAMSLAIFQSIEDEDLQPLLHRLPQDARGEVAAGSLKFGVDNNAMVMEMANLALASGNIDALASAA